MQEQEWQFAPKATTTREEQRARVVEAIDGPVIPWRYTRSGKRWRPRALVVTIERDRHNGGDWSPWRVMSWVLLGPNVKADGSEGADRSEPCHSHEQDHPAAVRAGEVAAAAERVGLPAAMHAGEVPAVVDLDG
jgi:hypothetical protein